MNERGADICEVDFRAAKTIGRSSRSETERRRTQPETRKDPREGRGRKVFSGREECQGYQPEQVGYGRPTWRRYVRRRAVVPRRERQRQSRVPRTNGGIGTRSAMTRARAIPANRAIPSLYICTWRWRSPGSLLPFGGFQRGNGECWRGRLVNLARGRSAFVIGRARRPRHPRNPCNFASSARVGLHRADSPKMAGTVSAFCCGGGDGGPLGADRYARRRIPAMAATVVVARHAS